MLPDIITNAAQAWISLKRINRFLQYSDLDISNVERSFDSNSEIAIEINDGYFSWGTNEKQHSLTLSGINLKIQKAKLIAIVGPIGCGKSSLLSAMIGDMARFQGSVIMNGSLGYASQQAWIQNGTIRQNILFGQCYNPTQYDNIIQACALKTDFEILSGGDATEIGEKGVNLSGGQKQRIALARALYQNRDILFLDDPLSAVDPQVGKHIFESVIGPRGLLRDKTRLLVTHGIQWLPFCDEIVLMAQGKITDQGSFQELMGRNETFATIIREHIENAKEWGQSNLNPVEKTRFSRRISSEMNDSTLSSSFVVHSEQISLGNGSQTDQKCKLKDVSENKLIEEETNEAGAISWSVFRLYIKALGASLSVSWFLFLVISNASMVYGNIWITKWTSDGYVMNATNASGPLYFEKQSYYIGLFGMSVVVQTVALFLHAVFYALSTLKASRALHETALDKLLHCPMSFFDTQPIGRILNRFSRDCDSVDNMLPLSLWHWLSTVMQVITTVILIIYGTPLFAAAMVPLAILYYTMLRLYMPARRQLKRIESVTRSPLYNLFSEMLTGASVIRAFGEQRRFLAESAARVDLNNTCYFAGISANRWLSVRLEMIGNLAVTATSLLAIFYRSSDNSSLIGLAISSALQITLILKSLVLMSADLEANVVSIERMEAYTRLPLEADWCRGDQTLEATWPDQGKICFENYSVRYRPGLPLVLNNVSFTINAGEKIGVIGRTGAGKSSLILALLRLIEPANGRIFIDNVDISSLGLHQLRSKLTILPQDPMIFSGSILYNADPFLKHPVNFIEKALVQAGLGDFISEVGNGLQHECGENGEALSVGQRQLLCLARVLLNKTSVLLLDEATASVDVQTDEQIMKTIRNEFTNCTVMIIAHRVNTIMNMDRILILDKGQVAEFDTPGAMLKNPQSILAEMVMETVRTKPAEIIESTPI